MNLLNDGKFFLMLGNFPGTTVGKTSFEAMKSGEKPGLKEFKADNKFNSSTGEFEPVGNEVHIILNPEQFTTGYSTPQILEGISVEQYAEDVGDFVTAEEATHALQKSADFTIKVEDDKKPGEFKEVYPVDENGKETKYSKSYENRDFENSAHENAKEVTGKDPLKLTE